MGPVTKGPPQEAPDQAGGLMASGGRLWMEQGVSGPRLRLLLRLTIAHGALAASFVASAAAPPIGASPKNICDAPWQHMRDAHIHLKSYSAAWHLGQQH